MAIVAAFYEKYGYVALQGLPIFATEIQSGPAWQCLPDLLRRICTYGVNLKARKFARLHGRKARQYSCILMLRVCPHKRLTHCLRMLAVLKKVT